MSGRTGTKWRAPSGTSRRFSHTGSIGRDAVEHSAGLCSQTFTPERHARMYLWTKEGGCNGGLWLKHEGVRVTGCFREKPQFCLEPGHLKMALPLIRGIMGQLQRTINILETHRFTSIPPWELWGSKSTSVLIPGAKCIPPMVTAFVLSGGAQHCHSSTSWWSSPLLPASSQTVN